MTQRNEIVLVRHGAVKTTSGENSDPSLSAEGRKQVFALVEMFSDMPIGHIWHSPLKRARETAELIQQGIANRLRKHLEIFEMDLLIESPSTVDCQKAGVQFNECKSLLWHGQRQTFTLDDTPEGRVARVITKRAQKLWKKIRSETERRGSVGVIVGHGGIFNALINATLQIGTDLDFTFDFDNVSAVGLHWSIQSRPTLRCFGLNIWLSKNNSCQPWSILEGEKAKIFDKKILKVRDMESERDHQADMYRRPLHIRRLEYIEDRLTRLAQGKAVFEVGCAEGKIAGLASTLGAHKVVGIDSATVKVERARVRFPKCHFEVTDLFSWKGSQCFDIVLCIEFLQHIRDYKRAIEIICGLVADNGRLLVSVPNRSIYRHRQAVISEQATEDELLKEIGGAGFGEQNALWSFSSELLRDEILEVSGFTLVGETYLGDNPWPDQPIELARRVFAILEFKKEN